MSSRTACAAAVVLLVSGATARVGRAQGGPTTIQLSFSNPGARSLGFGGAFVALADDATAAFANPAGLAQLTKPELSVEYPMVGIQGVPAPSLGNPPVFPAFVPLVGAAGVVLLVLLMGSAAISKLG